MSRFRRIGPWPDCLAHMTLDELHQELDRMQESTQLLQHKRLRIGRERLLRKVSEIEMEIASRATLPKNQFSN